MVYVGESSRSAFERALEHQESYRSMSEDSHMWRHAEEHHEGRLDVEYKFVVIRVFQKALMRQLSEAVRIRSRGEENIINEKGVYNRCAVPELAVVHNTRIWNEEKSKFSAKRMEGETEQDEDSITLMNATEISNKRRNNCKEDNIKTKTTAWGEEGETETEHKRRKLFLQGGNDTVFPMAGKQTTLKIVTFQEQLCKQIIFDMINGITTSISELDNEQENKALIEAVEAYEEHATPGGAPSVVETPGGLSTGGAPQRVETPGNKNVPEGWRKDNKVHQAGWKGGKMEGSQNPTRRMEKSELAVNGKTRMIIKRRLTTEIAIKSARRMEAQEMVHRIIQEIISNIVWIGEQQNQKNNNLIKMWCKNAEQQKRMETKKNMLILEDMKKKQEQIKQKRKAYLEKKKKKQTNTITSLWSTVTNKAADATDPAGRKDDRNEPNGWKEVTETTVPVGWKDSNMFDIEESDRVESRKVVTMVDTEEIIMKEGSRNEDMFDKEENDNLTSRRNEDMFDKGGEEIEQAARTVEMKDVQTANRQAIKDIDMKDTEKELRIIASRTEEMVDHHKEDIEEAGRTVIMKDVQLIEISLARRDVVMTNAENNKKVEEKTVPKGWKLWKRPPVPKWREEMLDINAMVRDKSKNQEMVDMQMIDNTMGSRTEEMHDLERTEMAMSSRTVEMFDHGGMIAKVAGRDVTMKDYQQLESSLAARIINMTDLDRQDRVLAERDIQMYDRQAECKELAMRDVRMKDLHTMDNRLGARELKMYDIE